MPRSSRSRRRMSRICAWIVTSSAVVGSSAISSLRIARQRHRDHHPLLLPAGHLVRIGIDPLLGLRDADLARTARSSAARASAFVTFWCSRIASITCAPDREHRVERGHRLLKDHADLFAADRPHLPARAGRPGPCPRSAIRPDSISRGRRQQPHDRQRRDALARPALADDPQRPPLLDAKRHVIHRLHDAVVGVEVGAEIIDFKHGVGMIDHSSTTNRIHAMTQ